LTHMGITSIAQGRPELAVTHFEQALQVQPDNRDAASMLRQLQGNSTP